MKFDEYKDNDPTHAPGEGGNPDYYSSGGNTRNLAFVLSDDKVQFFNYSYLITCSYDKGKGSIQMEFSTHHVELKGQRLDALFYELMAQMNKVIRCRDKRYHELEDDSKVIINEIIVINKAE